MDLPKCNMDCLNCALPECKHDTNDRMRRPRAKHQYKTVKRVYMTEFNNRIKVILTQKRMRQRTLSRITGINESTISDYTTGKRQPTLENLVMLCRALDVSADWLLGVKDEG